MSKSMEVLRDEECVRIMNSPMSVMRSTMMALLEMRDRTVQEAGELSKPNSVERELAKRIDLAFENIHCERGRIDGLSGDQNAAMSERFSIRKRLGVLEQDYKAIDGYSTENRRLVTELFKRTEDLEAHKVDCAEMAAEVLKLAGPTEIFCRCGHKGDDHSGEASRCMHCDCPSFLWVGKQ